MLSRREGSDDCFKARVAPQWVPERIETQMAISHMVPWQLDCLSQPFNCAILVARPRINDSQVLNHHRAIDGAFARRHQLDRALAFAYSVFLVSQSSINHTDRAKRCGVTGLVAHDLPEFSSSSAKRGTSCQFVPVKPGDETPAPTLRERDVFIVAPTCGHSCQCVLGGNRVTLAKGKVEPVQNDERRRVWVFGEGCFNCRV